MYSFTSIVNIILLIIFYRRDVCPLKALLAFKRLGQTISNAKHEDVPMTDLLCEEWFDNTGRRYSPQRRRKNKQDSQKYEKETVFMELPPEGREEPTPNGFNDIFGLNVCIPQI